MLDRTSLSLDWLARRMHPVIAYLDTDLSDTIHITRDGGATAVSAKLSQSCRAALKARLRTLSRAFLSIGYVMPARAAAFTEPGAGYHFGASLPHGPESDRFGRPHGCDRVHVVDSSVLPELEVGSITPTVMANAIRIVRQTVEEIERG
jgi:choline dehydrogenase-like flavoprotein